MRRQLPVALSPLVCACYTGARKVLAESTLSSEGASSRRLHCTSWPVRPLFGLRSGPARLRGRRCPSMVRCGAAWRAWVQHLLITSLRVQALPAPATFACRPSAFHRRCQRLCPHAQPVTHAQHCQLLSGAAAQLPVLRHAWLTRLPACRAHVSSQGAPHLHSDNAILSMSLLSIGCCCTACSNCQRRLPLQPALHLQIAKLLVIPFVCFVESSFLGYTFTRQVVASILLVVAGVAVVTGECPGSGAAPMRHAHCLLHLLCLFGASPLWHLLCTAATRIP